MKINTKRVVLGLISGLLLLSPGGWSVADEFAGDHGKQSFTRKDASVRSEGGGFGGSGTVPGGLAAGEQAVDEASQRAGAALTALTGIVEAGPGAVARTVSQASQALDFSSISFTHQASAPPPRGLCEILFSCLGAASQTAAAADAQRNMLTTLYTSAQKTITRQVKETGDSLTQSGQALVEGLATEATDTATALTKKAVQGGIALQKEVQMTRSVFTEDVQRQLMSMIDTLLNVEKGAAMIPNPNGTISIGGNILQNPAALFLISLKETLAPETKMVAPILFSLLDVSQQGALFKLAQMFRDQDDFKTSLWMHCEKGTTGGYNISLRAQNTSAPVSGIQLPLRQGISLAATQLLENLMGEYESVSHMRANDEDKTRVRSTTDYLATLPNSVIVAAYHAFNVQNPSATIENGLDRLDGMGSTTA